MTISPFTLGFFALLACSGCDVDKEEVTGTYTIKGLHNHTDTLQVLPNNTYVRTLYSRADNRLLFHNQSSWTYVNSTIILHDYLLDEDENFGPEATYGVGSMTCFLPVKKRLNKTVIYYKPDGDDSYFYEKL
jgi:hypothetical protein